MQSRALSPSTSDTGIIIPLYIYPGNAWEQVIAVAKANPRVPVIAIINPDNGPGVRADQNYVEWISSLQRAGVIVLGYIWTRYASRDLTTVRACINAYKDWYSVDGVFLDEMSNVPGNEAYYSILDDHAKSIGLTLTVGNPGDDVPSSYIGVLDTLVVHEGRGLPPPSRLRGWRSKQPKSNFAMIAYDVNSLDQSYVSEISGSFAYVYVTDDGLPNPYDALSTYLAALAVTLDLKASDNQQRGMNRAATSILGVIRRLEPRKS